jgi:hypothetical protein
MFRTDYYEKLDEYGQDTITKNTKWFMNLVDQFAHHLTVAMSVNIKALPKNTVLEVIRNINTNKDIYRVPFKVLFIEDQAFITKDGYVDSNRSDPHVYEVGENYPYRENKGDNVTCHTIYTKNELDKAINEALSEYKGTPEDEDVDKINENIDLITLIYKQISYTSHWEYPQEILAMLKDVIKYNLLRYISKENYALMSWYNKNKQLFEFTIGLHNVDSDATGELYSNLPDLINLDEIGSFELSSCGYVSSEEDD